MVWSRSLVLLPTLLLPTLGALYLTGCYTPPVPPQAPPAIVPATAEQTMDIQAIILKKYPNAHVGHVTAVDGSSHLAAIVGIPIGEVHKNDSIQFVDSKDGFANGTVINADASNPSYPTLVVEYEATASGRAPINGDLAIYIPRNP